MKKILHISKYYNPHIGGIESTCENIVRILNSTKEFQQRVICFGNEHVDFVDDIQITRVHTKLKIRSQSIAFSYTHQLKRVIKEFRPDIILFHAPNPFAARSLLKCHYEGKIIIFHHADIVKQKILKHFVKPYRKKVYEMAIKIIVTSKNYLENSEDLVGFKDKCVVIPLCFRESNIQIDRCEINEVEAIRKKYLNPIALSTGRHVGYKGLEYAIKAFRCVSGVTFLIAGTGPLSNSLKKMAKPYSNIRFIGMLNNRFYRIYLNAADFFIFPSCQKNEAFGISLVEALAAGKPAITFNIKGSAVNWINLNNVTGLECSNRNVEEMAAAINKLKNDENFRKKLGKNARNRTQKLFSETKFEKSILFLFNNV